MFSVLAAKKVYHAGIINRPTKKMRTDNAGLNNMVDINDQKKKKIDLCEQLKELLNCGVGEDS